MNSMPSPSKASGHLCSITAALLGFLTPLSVSCAEVRVALDAIFAEPSAIVIHPGDTVTWLVVDRWLATIKGFDEEFESPLMPPGSTYSRTFSERGVVAYRHRLFFQLGDPFRPELHSYGTIEVLESPSGDSQVFMSAPIPSARYGARTNETGEIIAPPRIVIQAAVADTNRTAWVEFNAGADHLGSVTNWPFQIAWFADRLGTVSLTATMVARDGTRFVSEPVEVSVEELAVPALQPPKRVRDGLYLVDYSLSPVFDWVLYGTGAVEEEIQIWVEGQWGRLPVTGRAPYEFFHISPRF